MSTVKLDPKRAALLDRLKALLLLRGRKISKQEMIGELIDRAAKELGEFDSPEIPLEKDPAWIGLSKTYSWGTDDLSVNVDKYLYGETE